MRRILLIGALSVGIFRASSVVADPIAITSYDITRAALSGSGGWAHSYTGTIDPVDAPFLTFPLANYTGGSGTLNDGIIGKTVFDTQLFSVEADSTITLHFVDVRRVDQIILFGGDIVDNSIPGAIQGTVAVTANGMTAYVPPTPFGRLSVINIPVNDRLSLLGTSLEGVMTDSISLSGFRVTPFSDSYSLTEIRVSTVPEPATLSLLAIGLVTAAGHRLHRRRPPVIKGQIAPLRLAQ